MTDDAEHQSCLGISWRPTKRVLPRANNSMRTAVPLVSYRLSAESYQITAQLLYRSYTSQAPETH